MIRILVVERSLLQARTIATMYETFDCEVVLASNVKDVSDLLVAVNIDIVIMTLSFCRDYGVETQEAIRAVQPDLRIAVLGEPGELSCIKCPPADFYVRPTSFYTDLRRHMALPRESPADYAP